MEHAPMTRYAAPLVALIILAISAPLAGCDSSAKLTEQEHIQRAKDFEDKGNLKGSIVELKNAIQKNPDSPQARLLLGQIYLKVGMGAEAEKELSQAEKLGVNRESIKPQLGEALLLMGEYQRVLDEIQPGEQTSRANLARILQLRADALLMQNKQKEACTLFQQSHDADTGNPPTYWGLARCAVAERNMQKAREWLDAALKVKGQQVKTWIFIGSLEQLNNNSQGAMAAYTNALKSEPSNLEALQSHATLSMTLGQWESASKDIEKARKLSPNTPGTYYLQALFNFHQKKYPEARDDLQKVLRVNPDHMPSVLLAGQTAYALGSYQQAESLTYRFLGHYPGNSEARKLLAATQIKLNQPAKALETLAPLLSHDAKDALALVLASEAYRIIPEPAKAAELLDRAALIDPKNALVKTQLGLSHLVAGDTLRAISELETAAALNSIQYQADNLLVLSHLERKEYDKALIAIDAMEKKLPDSPVTHNLRGKAYLGKDDLVNARKSFAKALDIDPAFFPAAASLAQLDLRDKQPEAARRRFESVLDKDKNNLQALMALAELAGLNKEEKGYVSWLEKAIKSHPEAIPPRAALLSHHMAKNEPQKALAVANEAVNANPDNPAALNLLGTLQLSINDKSGAITTFTKLTKRAPQSPDAYLRLALAQIADNNLKSARANLQEALQLKPDHLQSQDALLRLDMAENKPEAALGIARQIQAQQPKSPLGFDLEADIQLAQKHLPQAIKAYEQALEKGAGSAGLIKLHRALTLAGNTQAAEQRLSDWLMRHPDDNVVRIYAAEDHMRNGRNKEAIRQFQLVQRKLPNNPSVLNNLATLYQTENDKRALATAEQALQLAPDNPAVQDTLGWILVEQGQVSRGLDLLRKALAKAPKAPSIRYHHAVALTRTGEKAQARKELEQLLKDSPNFTEREAAQNLLKSLR
jgi:putative PEP-CTERM system TPR-repeat lipoprotein